MVRLPNRSDVCPGAFRAASGIERGATCRFIEVEPVLDFMVLEPGRAATDAIAQTASELKLGADYQARVRQTGRIPTDDDEFGTLKENAGLNAAVSLLAVLIILWLALRGGSARIIFAVAVSLLVGLAISAAWGLFLVGALNLISIAFFVLFIGLRCRFRNSVQRTVPCRASRLSRAAHRLAQHGGQGRRALGAGRVGDRGGIFLVPANRLPRPLRARRDCRLGDDHRFRHQHYLAAGAVGGPEPSPSGRQCRRKPRRPGLLFRACQ